MSRKKRAHFDGRETRSRDKRIASQLGELRALILHAKARAPAWDKALADIDPSEIQDMDALKTLPVTRKSALMEAQAADRPFGGYAALEAGQLARIFASPGPIYEPHPHSDGEERVDHWRFGRALYAAGIRAGDLLHNSFAYHLTPAGAMFESAAHAVGAAVFPAGPGNTEAQVRAIGDLKPRAYGGTPDFLKILLDTAAELRIDASSIACAAVSGAALPESLRAELKARGVDVLQCYGTADAGLIAYETPALEGMVVDEDVIVEIVRPGTGDAVPDGEVGEVVVTVLNRAYPLFRFALGDLSAVLPGTSPCGRTGPRIVGWRGRADQTAKVKGMFVHPHQVAAVVARHPEIAKARLVIGRDGETDAMTLHCESAEKIPAVLAEAIGESLRAVTNLSGAVKREKPGALANDGKVIDDTRPVD